MLRRMARIEDGVSQADFVRLMIRQEYRFRFLNVKTGHHKRGRRSKDNGKE